MDRNTVSLNHNSGNVGGDKVTAQLCLTSNSQLVVKGTTTLHGSTTIKGDVTFENPGVSGADSLLPSEFKGDIVVHNGTNNVAIDVGTDGQVLTADSAAPEGVSWQDASGGGAGNSTMITYEGAAASKGDLVKPVPDSTTAAKLIPIAPDWEMAVEPVTTVQWTQGETIVVGCDGYIYTAGYLDDQGGTTSFPPAGTIPPSNGKRSYFVKMHPNGTFIWLRWAECPGFDDANDFRQEISVDCNGNVYIVGEMSATLSLLPGGPTVPFTQDSTIFVAKLDSDGNWLWAKTIECTPGPGGAIYRDMKVNCNGDGWVVGRISGTATFFGGPTLSISANHEPFVFRFDTDGNPVWAVKPTRVAGSGFHEAQNIAVDNYGNAYVVHNFAGTYSFNNPDIPNIVSTNQLQSFMAKIGPTGIYQWVSHIQTDAVSTPVFEHMDTDGKYSYVTGRTSSTADDVVFGYGGTNPVAMAPTGDVVVFVAKYNNASGLCEWASSSTASGAGNEAYGYGVHVSTNGEVVVAGGFENTLSFGDITITDTSNAAAYDIFIARLDSAGNWISAINAGSNFYEEAYASAVDGAGNVYVTGYHDEPLTLGSLPTLSNQYNTFIARFGAGANATGFLKSAVTTGNPAEVHFNGIILDDVFANPLVPGMRYYISRENKIKTCYKCAVRVAGVAISDTQMVVDPQSGL